MKKKILCLLVSLMSTCLCASICFCQINCNNWLYLPSQPSAVQVGQLNVPGNQITVEALINRTQPYTGGILYAGDVVSKHDNPTDINYLLRPDDAEITTSNGYFRTPDICDIELNKTYHVAMTYDGAVLKLYRNGFLMSSVAATGDLFQNNWPTRIGFYFNQAYNENFLGYIDEVRIWNVVRTQSQIQTYMNTTLPNPTTQTGLLAYYQFNDLTNKQGNPAWNGTIVGSAVPDQTNPTCINFIADSCCPVLSGILTGDSICSGSQAQLTFSTTATTGPFTLIYTNGTDTFTTNNVQNNVPFNLSNSPATSTKYALLSIKDTSSCGATPVAGDTATVTVSTCTPSFCTGSLGDPVVDITFGSGTNPGQPLPTIVTGASTTLTYVAVTGNPATPTPVDGQYTITNNVPVNPDWFSGAFDHTSNNGTGYMAFYNASEQPGEFYSQTVNNLCGSTTYEFAAWIANALNPAAVIGVDPNITFSIEQADGTVLATYNTGDIPQTQTFTWVHYGFNFTTPANVSTVVLKMVNNNPGGTANLGNDLAIDDITFRPCGPITTASFSSTATVDTLKICEGSSANLFGTVSSGYNAPNYLWQVSTDSGATWTDIPNSNSLTLPVITIKTGIQKTYTYRIMTGEGTNISSPNCRVASNTVFLIVGSSPQAYLTGGTICNGDSASLLFTATSGTSPFNIAYWANGNGYVLIGLNNNSKFDVPYILKDTTIFTLTSITDATGCITNLDTTATVNVNPIPEGGISGNTACAGDSVGITFTSTSGTGPFEVEISDGTNTTVYYDVQSGVPFKINPASSTVQITLLSIIDQNGNGCSRNSGFTSPTATIAVAPSPEIEFDALTAICIQQSPFLITQAKETTGISGSGFFTGAGVDSLGNFSPDSAGVGNHEIVYTFIATDGCSSSDSSNIIVNPTPVVSAGSDIITCEGFPVQLNATGAATYVWSPTIGLDNPNKPNPIATPDSSTTYIVLGTDSNGCYASDTVGITVSKNSIAAFVVPNAFTPNGDGLNDCFGIRRWGSGITISEFSIFNRWGQLVFTTKNPADCWDGTYQGKYQPVGGYPYIIKVKTPCGDLSRTGVVMLVR